MTICWEWYIKLYYSLALIQNFVIVNVVARRGGEQTMTKWPAMFFKLISIKKYFQVNQEMYNDPISCGAEKKSKILNK